MKRLNKQLQNEVDRSGSMGNILDSSNSPIICYINFFLIFFYYFILFILIYSFYIYFDFTIYIFKGF